MFSGLLRLPLSFLSFFCIFFCLPPCIFSLMKVAKFSCAPALFTCGNLQQANQHARQDRGPCAPGQHRHARGVGHWQLRRPGHLFYILFYFFVCGGVRACDTKVRTRTECESGSRTETMGKIKEKIRNNEGTQQRKQKKKKKVDQSCTCTLEQNNANCDGNIDISGYKKNKIK